MTPRLVEVSIFQSIVSMCVNHNVAAYFYGSEEIQLFGAEADMDRVVDELVYQLGYVPNHIKKEVLEDQKILSKKIDRSIYLIMRQA
jgi:hypothetical protein